MTESTCGHDEELKVLRDIARLAGEWGVAMAENQVSPSPARRKRMIEVARQMSLALAYYKQFQGEKN